MAETPAIAPIGERPTVEEVGRRYVRRLENLGRKRSTVAAVTGHLAHWHSPFFGGRAIDAMRAEDAADLVALMRRGDRPGGLKRTKAAVAEDDPQRDWHPQRSVPLCSSAQMGRREPSRRGGSAGKRAKRGHPFP